ncbi:hypothetical protein CEUSTIGMA_g13349.t1 [Chlamydomonas eustigma]|uniref:Clp R domain-containing protein n=1 Tax=Chlamydomonas eustigma TaxID=1157962 RepID=A0A250XSD1_9CHLO|nr:hypothetical protein CEUSTIGMA_g13349.t1 [Chlamydomonas eustigma]|eukprot:GAX85933.1 hypothetical protein CEUSTIGMA_g13349.t1 [Chlamydomonas eustigma]
MKTCLQSKRHMQVLDLGGSNISKSLLVRQHAVKTRVGLATMHIGQDRLFIRQISSTNKRTRNVAPALRTTLSSDTKECLMAASQYASQLGHSHVEPRHLLLGLIKSGHPREEDEASQQEPEEFTRERRLRGIILEHLGFQFDQLLGCLNSFESSGSVDPQSDPKHSKPSSLDEKEAGADAASLEEAKDKSPSLVESKDKHISKVPDYVRTVISDNSLQLFKQARAQALKQSTDIIETYHLLKAFTLMMPSVTSNPLVYMLESLAANPVYAYAKLKKDLLSAKQQVKASRKTVAIKVEVAKNTCKVDFETLNTLFTDVVKDNPFKTVEEFQDIFHRLKKDEGLGPDLDVLNNINNQVYNFLLVDTQYYKTRWSTPTWTHLIQITIAEHGGLKSFESFNQSFLLTVSDALKSSSAAEHQHLEALVLLASELKARNIDAAPDDFPIQWREEATAHWRPNVLNLPLCLQAAACFQLTVPSFVCDAYMRELLALNASLSDVEPCNVSLLLSGWSFEQSPLIWKCAISSVDLHLTLLYCAHKMMFSSDEDLEGGSHIRVPQLSCSAREAVSLLQLFASFPVMKGLTEKYNTSGSSQDQSCHIAIDGSLDLSYVKRHHKLSPEISEFVKDVEDLILCARNVTLQLLQLVSHKFHTCELGPAETTCLAKTILSIPIQPDSEWLNGFSRHLASVAPAMTAQQILAVLHDLQRYEFNKQLGFTEELSDQFLGSIFDPANPQIRDQKESFQVVQAVLNMEWKLSSTWIMKFAEICRKVSRTYEVAVASLQIQLAAQKACDHFLNRELELEPHI